MADLTFLMNVGPGRGPEPVLRTREAILRRGRVDRDRRADQRPDAGGCVHRAHVAEGGRAGTINLVSHASAFAAMICPVTLASQAAGDVTHVSRRLAEGARSQVAHATRSRQ